MADNQDSDTNINLFDGPQTVEEQIQETVREAGGIPTVEEFEQQQEEEKQVTIEPREVQTSGGGGGGGSRRRDQQPEPDQQQQEQQSQEQQQQQQDQLREQIDEQIRQGDITVREAMLAESRAGPTRQRVLQEIERDQPETRRSVIRPVETRRTRGAQRRQQRDILETREQQAEVAATSPDTRFTTETGETLTRQEALQRLEEQEQELQEGLEQQQFIREERQELFAERFEQEPRPQPQQEPTTPDLLTRFAGSTFEQSIESTKQFAPDIIDIAVPGTIPRDVSRQTIDEVFGEPQPRESFEQTLPLLTEVQERSVAGFEEIQEQVPEPVREELSSSFASSLLTGITTPAPALREATPLVQPSVEEAVSITPEATVEEIPEKFTESATLSNIAAELQREPRKVGEALVSGFPQLVQRAKEDPVQFGVREIGVDVGLDVVLGGAPVARVQAQPEVTEDLVSERVEAPFTLERDTAQLTFLEEELPTFEQLPTRAALEEDVVELEVFQPFEEAAPGLLRESEQELVAEEAAFQQFERRGAPQRPATEEEQLFAEQREFLAAIPEEEVFTPEIEGQTLEEQQGLSREEIESLTGFTPEELLVLRERGSEVFPEEEAPPLLGAGATGLLPESVQEQIVQDTQRPATELENIFREEEELPILEQRTERQTETPKSMQRAEQEISQAFGLEQTTLPAVSISPFEETDESIRQQQQQDQEEITELVQQFTQAAPQAPQPQQVEEEPVDPFEPFIQQQPQQRPQPRPRPRGGRDQDTEQLDQEIQQAFGGPEQETQFAPSLEALFTGDTITREEAERREEEGFTGFETRPAVATDKKLVKDFQDAFGL